VLHPNSQNRLNLPGQDISNPLMDLPNPLYSYPKSEGRRRKSAILLIAIWLSIGLLHLSSVGLLFTLGLTSLMGVHALLMLVANPGESPAPILAEALTEDCPFVSLVVAAKDEEAVIQSLVQKLCSISYPPDRYELWVVDDNSGDRTPQILAELAQTHPQLHWMRRAAGSTGGKSGALNQILPLMKGDLIGVFDADAQVSADLLHQVLPHFINPSVGAVQVRKVIANAETNFWTRGQGAEMILDAFLHERRNITGGIGELRGNGQFVRRTALERCGKWNEETITDDLDLTFRLHLDHWDIASVLFPVVQEEGVTHAVGLWHQRNRWAEGGYQRYLDYWPLLLRNQLGYRKSFDLGMFWLLQYIVPTAVIPDTLMSLWRGQMPILLPLSSLTMSLSFVGMFAGLNRIRRRQKQPLALRPMLIQSVLGTLYMAHWFVVIASVTARMAIRPKRFNWVKTLHVGQSSPSVN
jgi:1,2-diacylglycerol 3-beta-glucosyltransferase